MVGARPICLQRLALALLAAAVLCLAVPAAASAFGSLTQKPGTAGCVNNTGSEGCQTGTRVGGSALAISPDGKNVYATGFDSTSAVAVFDRDPLTGELTQKPLPAGCNSGGGVGGCRSVTAMVKPDGVAVSHDGKNVYVADFDQNSVMVFEREPDGSLVQLPGPDGCFSASGHGGSCTVANGLSRESRVAVSPDDKNVYVASSGGGGAGALAIFDRDITTGKLSQKPGAEGCLSSDGFAPCAAVTAMGHPEGIAISPGSVGDTVYVTARSTDSVLVFDRAADGTLTQLPSPDGCWVNGIVPSCATGVGLDNGGPAKNPAVSPDGKNVYVPASGSGGVAVFDRNASTGAIDQKDGAAGCVTWDGTGGGCQVGFGLRDAAEVVVSPDGESVYVAGVNADSGIAVFDRDGSSGELTQRPGKEGCISASGSGGACETGRGLPAIAIAISPDNQNVYAGGIAVFDRDAAPEGEEEGETPGCPGDSDCDGLPDPADVCPGAPGPGSLDGCPLRLDEVVPRTGGAGAVTLRLRGRGFQANPSVRLVRDGHPDIPAGSVARTSAQSLSVGFDLGDAKPGSWEIVVDQSDPAASARRPFSVMAAAPPLLRARLVGRETALNGYPWSGVLQVSNEGSVDARNALVRIDGFYSLSDASVIGPGATVTQLDSGRSQSLLVSIDRIPQKTTKMLLVRFTAVGPGHSRYSLRPTVLATSLPKARPVDPSVQITPELKSSSASGESGVLQVTGGGRATYSVRLSDQNLGAPPTFKTIRSGEKIRVELSATMPAPATGPPGGASASDTSGLRRINLSAESNRKTNGSVEVFEDLSGSYQLTISRKGVLDCLLTRRELPSAEYENLVTQADGVFTAQLIKSGSKLVPGGGAAGQGVKYALSFGPDLMSANFEAHLGRALRDQGAGDPNSPYFGLNHEEIVKLAYRNCLPDPPPPGVEEFSLEVLTPGDPNDKVGPAGFRGRHYVARGAQMPYLVMFENVPSASAPAHEVRITDQLDATKLDLSSLELGPVYFGDRVLTPPPGLQSWRGSVDLRPEKNLIVSVDAALDRGSGVLSWHFRGLDPATGELETAAELGFLPPNRSSPEGQGGVSFSVSQVPGLPHGTAIANGATIVFDREQPIATPVFVNRIDARAPRSTISATKQRRSRPGSCGPVRLKWRGRDSGAGVALHDVLLSRDGRAYGLWRGQTKRRSAVFAPRRPGAYAFFSSAIDGAGNATPVGGSWERLVAGVSKKGQGLALKLRRRAAKQLRVNSVRVVLDGRTVATRPGVPGRVRLTGVGSGPHRLTLLARTKAGKKAKAGKGGTIRATRLVVFCAGR